MCNRLHPVIVLVRQVKILSEGGRLASFLTRKRSIASNLAALNADFVSPPPILSSSVEATAYFPIIKEFLFHSFL